MVNDGHTYAVPFCDECPPLRDWSAKALVRGTCERCGRENPKAWRELRAREALTALSKEGQRTER